MKLLLCEECNDVRKLDYEVTSCKCGRVKARYLRDGWHAEHNGLGFLLGMNNSSLGGAIHGFRQAAEVGNDMVNQEPSPFVFDAWVMTGNPRVAINPDL